MNLFLKKIGVMFILSCCFLSCQQNKSCCENSDIVNIHNFYNVTDWRPFLDKRLSRDRVLQEKLLRLSILLGEFARDIIDISGGMNSDGSLMNPCTTIGIDKSKIEEFYQSINFSLEEIRTEDVYLKVYEDLNTMFQYNFYRENGSLSQNVMLSSNVQQIASKLLFYENYCYFLIVKYA